MRGAKHLGYDPIRSGQLRWLTRWRAIGAVLLIALAVLDLIVLHRHDQSAWMVGLGAFMLAYNFLPRRLWTDRRQRAVLALAATQVFMDLGCLTVLTLWTGGTSSPLLWLFVLHMIVSALLFSRRAAYAMAGAAVAAVVAGLSVTNALPRTSAVWGAIAAWGLILFLTVGIVAGIAKRLRRMSLKHVAQNRRLLSMAKVLGSQQKTIIQSERLVAMGQMAAGIAHEIANPLANLDGLLQLMGHNPSRLTPENMVKLNDQCARIRGTIQKMTQFAHPTPNDRSVVNLNDVAAAGIEMVRFDPRRRSVRIDRDFASPGGHVCVQMQSMEQVMTNLLMNALDAVADQDEPRIIVRTGVGGGRGRIEIIDNGPGIPPDLRQRVFDPFFTTKPVGKGTGLGLAICYRLVTAQRGEISVEPAPGGGAIFRVDLDLIPTREVAPVETDLHDMLTAHA